MEINDHDLNLFWAIIRLGLALISFLYLFVYCYRNFIGKDWDRTTPFLGSLFLSNMIMNLLFVISSLAFFLDYEQTFCPILGIIDMSCDLANLCLTLALGFVSHDDIKIRGRKFKIHHSKNPFCWAFILSAICLGLGILINFLFGFEILDFKCYVNNGIFLILSEFLICVMGFGSSYVFSENERTKKIVRGNVILARSYLPFVLRDFLKEVAFISFIDLILATIGYITMSSMGIFYYYDYKEFYCGTTRKPTYLLPNDEAENEDHVLAMTTQ